MAYPSILSAISNPQASDRLNSPSHSSIHQAENTAITEIETFVGTLSSTAGTLVYDIRAAASNGGGHVQTANKGGTGQTSFTKGDLLVASSSSVLTKLAVGTDGQALIAQSGNFSGLGWTNAVSNKIAVVSSTLQVSGVNTTIPFYSASILGSVLGTNNAIKFTVALSSFAQGLGGRGASFSVNYGNNTILTLSATAAGAIAVNTPGLIHGMIIADGATNAQKAIGWTDFLPQPSITGTTSYGTSSVESSAVQSLVITAALTGANTYGSIVGQFLTVEKIA